MILKLDDKGRLKEVTIKKVFREDITFLKKKLEDDFETVKHYLHYKTKKFLNENGNNSVSLFKIAPNPWGYPLDKIYHVLNIKNFSNDTDAQNKAAQLAGIMLHLSLEECLESYISAKTPVTKRDFEVNCYFKKRN